MKKRWLAACLSLLMCISLLPLPVTATGGESTLFMRRAQNPTGNGFEQNLSTLFYNYTLTTGWVANVVFYSGTEDEATPIPFSELRFDNLTATQRTNVADEAIIDCVTKITAGEVGTGTVIHEPSNTTFTVTILPEILLYETANFEGNALKDLQFESSDAPITGVLKATDGWAILGTVATSAHPAPAFVTVSPVDDQEYATISLDTAHADFAPGSYQFTLLTRGVPYGSETPISMEVDFQLTVVEAYTEPALYSQPELKDEYLLGNEISYTGGSLEFYVLWDNLNVNGIAPADGVDLAGQPEEFVILNEDGDLVGYKLKVENPKPGVYSFELKMSGEWEYFEFSIVDNRPLFRCRELTRNGDDYVVNTDDLLRTIVSGKASETIGYVFYEVVGENETELTLDQLTFSGAVTAKALNEEETWLELTFGDTSGEVLYTAEDGTELTLPVVISDADTSDWDKHDVPSFEFDDKTYKIGLASGDFIYDDVPLLTLHDDEQTVTDVSQDEASLSQYVMAVVDEDGTFKADLSACIEITDVSITEFYSLGGTCSVAIAEEEIDYYGTQLRTINLTTQGACLAQISVEYALVLPGGRVEDTADFCYRALPRGEYDLDLSTADTAAELNALFSSPEALVAWMEDNAPEEYELYELLESLGAMGMSHFNLQLPAATYDDVIIVQLKDAMVNIYGATNRNGDLLTVMPGLHLKDKSPACNLIDIHFQHNPQKELLYDTLSCAVLAYGDANTLGDGNAILNCIIEGFDCAVRNTPYGHIGLGTNNLIRKCTYGLYMDCAGKEGGSISTDISRSTFVDCQVGIYIKTLPDYIEAYRYRVYYCDFIDVETDFKVEENGTFYFYQNFYGSVTNSKTFDQVTVITDFLTRIPTVALGENTTAITNPRFVLSCAWFKLYGNNNYLSVDSARETIILNAEADDLVMDTDELSKEVAAADQAVVIDVADQNQDIQATWTIN